MCLLFFVKVRQNDKSLLPLQQIEDVAFLATCFPLNIFPTGGKNVKQRKAVLTPGFPKHV